MAEAYEKIDPLAVLPVYMQLIENEPSVSAPKRYRAAVWYLNHMRTITAGTKGLTTVDAYIANLRYENRHRPRLQQAFDRAGLP